MAHPITHYLVIKNAMISNKNESLWSSYSNYAAFGSFTPDVFYLKDVGYLAFTDKYDYSKISDYIHWDGSLDLYCYFLDYIKENYELNTHIFLKLKAFSYGFYSHIITDSIFHPYISRKTKDHWKKHEPVKNYVEHKYLESLIDSFLLTKNEKQNAKDFKYHEKVLCYQDMNYKTLDNEIFLILLNGLNNVYSKIIDNNAEDDEKNFYEYFLKYELDDTEHPIHEAYDDFVDTISILYKNEYIGLLPSESIKAFIPKIILAKHHNEKMNLNKSAWFKKKNNFMSLNYSVLELFEMAVLTTKKLINISESFFNQNELSSKEYLKLNSSDMVIFEENFNSDTGLSSKYNYEESINSEDNQIRYNAFIDDLVYHYLCYIR